jgi:hypothetical protein
MLRIVDMLLLLLTHVVWLAAIAKTGRTTAFPSSVTTVVDVAHGITAARYRTATPPAVPFFQLQRRFTSPTLLHLSWSKRQGVASNSAHFRNTVTTVYAGASCSDDDEIDTEILEMTTRTTTSTTDTTTTTGTTASSYVEYPDFLPNPNPSLSAVDVVTACMDTLLQYHYNTHIGLEVCFHFSSDRCRAALGGSLDEFTSYAQNPTFIYLVTCQSYHIVSIGPIIPGTAHRGSMQTVLIETCPSKTSGRSFELSTEQNRRFLWTLQQERRPPLQGCWMIHEVLYTKNAFHQTV